MAEPPSASGTGVTTAPVPEPAKSAPAETLDSHDAVLLAEAQSSGADTVTMIVSTDPGRASGVAASIVGLGGTVSRRFDKVGYVLAQVPTGDVVKASRLPGVSTVDLNETVPLPEPEGEPPSAAAATLPGPDATTPAVNPYLPTDEIGSVRFKNHHPEYDGRGVTIGVMDSGVDLDHPALTTTSTGARKIVDWVTATDPLTENDRTWRPMLTQVSGPSFDFGGATYTAPAGTWTVNSFAEAITAASEPEGDVNRDGDTTDVWGILYDPQSHDIRVDVNQNHDFTDDAVMRPYREKYDVGHFGTDDPATPVVERMPFVVEYREDVDLTPAGRPGVKADFVNIGITEGLHGSHVAGIAAGNDMFGNAAFDGQAPGATIVSSRACSWGGGCTAAALTTGMVDLVVNRHVDVVNMSIGGLQNNNNGANARAELYNRLIRDYGVQIFISAGNSGPGVNTVGDPSVATDVVSVAASVSKATWLSNYGSTVRTKLGLFPFSSRGPREDGGFKPNITAPGSAISSVNLWQQVPGLAAAGYVLPIGYAMENGTSMSSPQATGGAALLLSAAKARGLAVTPAALRRALYSSADLIPGVPVVGQGNGQMDVNGAWSLLARRIQARTYTSSAPVCTPFSGTFATPGRGAGIHNRCAAGSGGQRAGRSRTYAVKLTRTSGPAGTVRHDLSWAGDSGSFRSPRSVGLPLNKTVTVAVTVTPQPGLNSAILHIDDPDTVGVDFEVLNTVVTGTEPRKPDYAMTVEGSVDRNSTTSYFLTVPEGTTALQVNLSGIATGSQTRWLAINPWGVPVEDNATANCYTNYSDPKVCAPVQRSYADPLPGIWEFEVEARRTSPTLENPFSLTARVQGVTVEPAEVHLSGVTSGEPAAVQWTVRNRFAPLTVTGRGGSLGSALRQRPTIAEGDDQEYSVTVPAGAERLEVSIGNVSDTSADLDLTVSLNGALVAQSADGDSEEAVSIAAPQAGTYTVTVGGFAVPSGSTEYDYADVYYSKELGSLTVPGTPVALASGATATITGSVTATQAPVAGRSLFGDMVVTTSEGALVGRGSVVIDSVD